MTSTPGSPTVPADVPTTGPNAKPGERPPLMPVEATKHTIAGARAFAKFFLQTIDWGYATTSSNYMRRYFQPSCDECRVTRLALDNAHRDNEHYIGSRLTIVKVGQPRRGGPRSADLTIQVTLNITSVELIDRDGRASHPDVAYNGFREQVGLRWDKPDWTTVWIHGKASNE